MKHLLVLFITFLPFCAYSQCSLGINFGDLTCDGATNKFYVPINISAVGTGNTMSIEFINTDFDYPIQNFSFSTDRTILVYGESDGTANDFDIKVTVTGGTCSSQSLQKKLSYTAPVSCLCESIIIINSTLAQNREYKASDLIEASTNISGNTITLSANNSVTLKAGFHYIATNGHTLTINNEGCEQP